MARLTCDGYQARLGFVLELAMAAFRAGQEPAAVFNELNRIPNLHLEFTLGSRKRQCQGCLEL